MDTANREWVIYDPPKSVSFGHVSRIRDPRRAWLVTQEFLMTLTEFTQDDPTDLSFYGPEVGCDAVVATERVSDARRVLALKRVRRTSTPAGK